MFVQCGHFLATFYCHVLPQLAIQIGQVAGGGAVFFSFALALGFALAFRSGRFSAILLMTRPQGKKVQEALTAIIVPFFQRLFLLLSAKMLLGERLFCRKAP